MSRFVLPLFFVLTFQSSAFSAETQNNQPHNTLSYTIVDPADFNSTNNLIDEIDPFNPKTEKVLEELDQNYFEETGLSPFIENQPFSIWSSCYRKSCPVWVQIVKSTQSGYLFLNGTLVDSFKVSTGIFGRTTPNFDKHPDGRIYDAYSSTKFPGGSYKGLGNMPYAVFIQNGFALHGTTAGNWKKLGKRASHGCVRMHPDNAKTINRLVRQYGVEHTWITIQD
ncbi:MAG: L,D-transpeptidase [Bdellovibrio sp.]